MHTTHAHCTVLTAIFMVNLGHAQNPLHTFPRTFPIDGEVANLLRTCCGLVSDMTNKSTTSCCNGIWEMTRHNRHNRLLPVPTCYRLITDLWFMLWTCYRLVTDFSFMLRTCCGLATGKSPRFYGETCVMDYRLSLLTN